MEGLLLLVLVLVLAPPLLSVEMAVSMFIFKQLSLNL